MNSLPATIKHESAFMRSLPAGYDGAFDWGWTEGCFPGNITPMDIDAFIERRGNFLAFETKGLGVPVPMGQRIALEQLHYLRVFTIVFIAGKSQPEQAEIWRCPGFQSGEKDSCLTPVSVEYMRDFVMDWVRYAEANPKRGGLPLPGKAVRSATKTKSYRNRDYAAENEYFNGF